MAKEDLKDRTNITNSTPLRDFLISTCALQYSVPEHSITKEFLQEELSHARDRARVQAHMNKKRYLSDKDVDSKISYLKKLIISFNS